MSFPFDGSSLGEHEFSVVQWANPVSTMTSVMKTVVFYATIRLSPEARDEPVILKRNCAARKDQLVIDELKPLFGLQKMGSHRIRLHGVPMRVNTDYPWVRENIYINQQWSEYFVFKATGTVVNNQFTFEIPHTIQIKHWEELFGHTMTDRHKTLYYEYQKVFVFREMVRVSDTSESNVLLKVGPTGPYPLSIDEMQLKLPTEPSRLLTSTAEKFYFARVSERAMVIIRMLGLQRETYLNQLQTLRNSIARIINRVDTDKIWLADVIIDKIVDKISIYYSMIDSEN